MKDLIILGGIAHGAEMAEIVERMNHVKNVWNLLGFIVSEEEMEKKRSELNGYPILGTSELLVKYPNAFFAPDVSTWARSLNIPLSRMISLIDPSAFVSRSARIGVGCVIYPHCFIGLNAVLGNYVFCLSGSIINHDVVLEDRVVITSGVSLAGYVHVERDCYLGQACTCKQFVRIGSNSLIGMGSVVLDDVPASSVMIGNPARKLKENIASS